jgi:hypothetical protein
MYFKGFHCIIISDSRFLILKGGAYRTDNSTERKDRVNFILGAGCSKGPTQTSS